MGGTYRSARLPVRGPPAIGRFHQKLAVDGRLRKKKGRRRGKGKKEVKKEYLASAVLARLPSSPAFSLARGDRSRRQALSTSPRPPPLFLIASNEEKTAAKKPPPCKVLHIRDAISRFSNRRRFRPLAKNTAKKKPSRHLAVRGQHRPRFFLFLFLLPCFSLFFSLLLA
ncbi:hypothetical protein GW17_00047785 [Ensete ventricosum]|nr:hypothetical protein GW17_00047785 [Ensete ventricosum]